MPEWLHDRAKHILRKNPDMPEGEAFAIATQQSHALGKSPKSYGTVKGRRTAEAKYQTPNDDVKTASLENQRLRDKTASLFSRKTNGPYGLNAQGRVDKSVPYDAEQHYLQMKAHDLRHPESPSYSAAGVSYPTLTPEQAARTREHMKGWSKTAAWRDKLPGGLSDKKNPKDFNAIALKQGRKIESEHTKDKHLQTEISMDHLTEDPQYYKKLKKTESDKTASVLLAALLNEISKISAVSARVGQLKPASELTDNEFGDEKDQVKIGYAVSQYSGPLSMGRFKQESYLPPFNMPQLKTAGPPSEVGRVKRASEDDLDFYGDSDMPKIKQESHLPPFRAPALRRKMAGALVGTSYSPGKNVGGGGTTAGSGGAGGLLGPPQVKFSPGAQLAKSQNVAKVPTTPPGPTVATLAKPVGYGKPMPGATKTLSA